MLFFIIKLYKFHIAVRMQGSQRNDGSKQKEKKNNHEDTDKMDHKECSHF